MTIDRGRYELEVDEFFVDEEAVKVVEQSPSYPLQFMLSLYEFADGPEPASPPDAYPKVAVVEQFLGWRPASGPGARLPTGPHEVLEPTRIADPA